jgi:phenylacetic acid degradation operon negative regulatory protein
MQPTPKSLILDLLSTLRRDAMPVRALVAAAELFGIAENSLRVALARLVASGTVERDERGLYRMGPRAAAVQSHVVAWRRTQDRVVEWRGGWVGVLRGALPRSERALGRRAARALRFLGFRPLDAGLDVRPDNLSGGVQALREQLRALGLDAGAPVFGLSGLDSETEARARGLWDPSGLSASHRQARVDLERSAGRLADLAPREAMRESFLLGGRVIRQLALDPLLPDQIAPAAERRALVETMLDYDRLGRALWAGFMRGFGLEHARTPLDLRVADAARSLMPATGEVL